MKILVAGGSGFVGKSLAKSICNDYDLTLLSRSAEKLCFGYRSVVTWEDLSEDLISKYDIVINLCGYDIGKSRWSKSTKNRILLSRINSTQRLVDLISDKNIWLINASAIGFYSCSIEPQDEISFFKSTKKLRFSEEVVNKWESVIKISELKRYTILRLGVVIGEGGVLEKIISTSKFKFLTIFSDGKQIMSWISLHDLGRALKYVIKNNYSQKEIFNLTAPNTVSNKSMVTSIQKITNVRFIINIPKIFIKLMLGQMGYELLLSNQNIKPKRLMDKGFNFNDLNIDNALKRYL